MEPCHTGIKQARNWQQVLSVLIQPSQSFFFSQETLNKTQTKMKQNAFFCRAKLTIFEPNIHRNSV